MNRLPLAGPCAGADSSLQWIEWMSRLVCVCEARPTIGTQPSPIRYPIHGIAVLLEFGDGHDSSAIAELLDISTRGIGIETDALLTAGQVIQVSIRDAEFGNCTWSMSVAHAAEIEPGLYRAGLVRRPADV